MFLNVSTIVWIAVFTNAIAALSFYLSYAAGTLNVSQAGFMAVGGYSVGMITTRNAGPIWLGIIIGIAISIAVGWLLAMLTAQLSGIYLAMATLAFVIVIGQVITIEPKLGGAVGLAGIPSTLTWQYALITLVVVFLIVRALMRTTFGFQIRLTREDLVMARATGINVFRLRSKTIVLSAALASVAGSMYALQSSFIGPQNFGFSLIISILSFAIVGGTDRWWGPVVGALVLTLLPELTQAADVARQILTGVLILAVLVIFPEGIVGFALRLGSLLRSGRNRGRPDPEATIVRPDGPDSVQAADPDGLAPSATRRGTE